MKIGDVIPEQWLVFGSGHHPMRGKSVLAFFQIVKDSRKKLCVVDGEVSVDGPFVDAGCLQRLDEMSSSNDKWNCILRKVRPPFREDMPTA